MKDKTVKKAEDIGWKANDSVNKLLLRGSAPSVPSGNATGAPLLKPKLSPNLEEIVAKMTPEQRYSKFLRMLHDRKMSVERLAQLATKRPNSRTHVLQVLQGKRNGECTWSRLVDFLTRDELIVLGKKELIIVEKTI